MGLDRLLGTKEGRSRLLIIMWILSLLVTLAGFVIMGWIFYNGGL